MQDLLWECLTDTFTGAPMAITAENLAEKYDISRDDANAYALASQTRWAEAHAAGKFADEIVPIELKSRRGTTVFDTDEHPRPSTPESLAKLPPVFIKGTGRVTAGNASGICDGASSLVVADAKWAEQRGLAIARLAAGVCRLRPDDHGHRPGARQSARWR